MMLSEDSKLRLKGEFYQAKIRYLDLVCSIHDKEKELPVIEAFNNSELESLKKLQAVMEDYISILHSVLFDSGVDTTDWR